jgi:hypothetical protein
VAKVEEFAHGCRYGDYSGVVLYGPPTDGFWLDRLAVSDCYIDPLFRGVLDWARQESGGKGVPRLAAEWNAMEGWAADGGLVPVAPADAAEFAQALSQIGLADLSEHCAGSTPEECLRCAAVVREFIDSRLARGINLFIEDD